MPATLPTGIGNPQQAQQATAFIREQPWYQSLVKSWGIDPTDVDANGNLKAKLSDEQEQQVLKAAQDNGIGISEDSYHIDENGQIAKNDSHWVRNALIGAGIGAAALTGFGAAGIGPLSGLFGAGAEAAAASPFAIPATEGIASATSLGLPVTAGLGSAGAAATAAGAGGTLAKISSLLPDIGKGIGAATTAAGQNDLNQEQAGLQAAGIDISGQQAYTNEEIAVAKENAAMQEQQLKDQYMLGKAKNPGHSPFDPVAPAPADPTYLSTLSKLANADPEFLTAPKPYTPITPSGAQKATGTTPSTLQTIGNWLSPGLSLAPKIAKLF